MDVMTWLTQVRKLDAALLDKAGVKPKEHPQLGDVAAFPYVRNGKPYAAKFRKPDPKDWRSSQGISRGLYNEDSLTSQDGPAVITEGEPIVDLDVSDLFANPRNPRYGYLSRFDEAHAAMAREVYGSFPLSEVVADDVTFVRYIPEA